MFLLELLIDFFIDFGMAFAEKFNYSRKTKRESIVFFTCTCISCLAAIVVLGILFFRFTNVGVRIACAFGAAATLLAFALQLSRFLQRMK